MVSGLLFLLLLGNMFSEVWSINHLIICENSVVQLKCGRGKKIHVRSADYGRHDSTTCSAGRPPSQLQNVSCSTLSSVVAHNCNGHRSCSITASNSVFGDPCPGTYKYLDVAFSCR
nr:L-rhamnose-binding lectin SML-like [Nothobranchius furzeri]